MPNKKVTKKKNSHFKQDQLNYEQNKPLGLDYLDILFDNVRLTKWYINVRRKIVLINLVCFKRKEKLHIQREIFIQYFNQYYNFDYDFIYQNDELNEVYNRRMTVFKIFRPY